MFMFRKTVEVENETIGKLKSEILYLTKEVKTLQENNRNLQDELRQVKWEKECMQREYELRSEEKLNALRKEMQHALIESDIKRADAIARLEIYEKTDTKADANAIKEMIGKLIEQLGKQPPANINVVK